MSNTRKGLIAVISAIIVIAAVFGFVAITRHRKPTIASVAQAQKSGKTAAESPSPS